MFNTRLDSAAVRAVDFREGDIVNEAALRGPHPSGCGAEHVEGSHAMRRADARPRRVGRTHRFRLSRTHSRYESGVEVNRPGNSRLLPRRRPLLSARRAARSVPRRTADVAAVRSDRAARAAWTHGACIAAGQMRAEGGAGPSPICITSSSPCGLGIVRGAYPTGFEEPGPEEPPLRHRAGPRRARGEITMSQAGTAACRRTASANSRRPAEPPRKATVA